MTGKVLRKEASRPRRRTVTLELELIVSILSNRFQKPEIMIESATGALCRFIVSTNHDLHKKNFRTVPAIESSFCLLEANVVNPLSKVLDEADVGACNASLDAFFTLINGEQLQKGSKVLESGDVIPKIVKLLSLPDVRFQVKSLVELERIFR
ncbi:hypothetical protein L1887_11470 [Cichorium endivia]|nr:hypothetical protein L1887_11470 [Cichorium endivia]